MRKLGYQLTANTTGRDTGVTGWILTRYDYTTSYDENQREWIVLRAMEQE
jgi:hypothetical protein